jgi:hypothetical protein
VRKVLSVYRYSMQNAIVPRFRQTVPIDDYVLDVLMRDIVGHDQQPAASSSIFIFPAAPLANAGNR